MEWHPIKKDGSRKLGAPRPWVILLAIGLGLLAFNIVLAHSKRIPEAAQKIAAGHSTPAGQRTAPPDLRGFELAPPSRTLLFRTLFRTSFRTLLFQGASPVEVFPAALPPDPAVFEGEGGTSLAAVAERDDGLRHGPASHARAPPPPFPA